jgi:hypothetical protein
MKQPSITRPRQMNTPVYGTQIDIANAESIVSYSFQS